MIEFIDQVLIQRYIDRDNESLTSAENGFKQLGVPVQRFDSKIQLESLPLSKSTLVCGGIGVVVHALDLLGVSRPEAIDYPIELVPFYGREIWEDTLGKIRKDDLDGIFIKPKEQKLFPGHIRGSVGNLMQTASYEDDVRLWCSEVVNFISEYRVFLSSGKIVGCKHYKGDFLIFPDRRIIESCAFLIKDKYPTCSLDIGITNERYTLVVECNDAFALGSYGLSDVVYAKMLEARWLEMVNMQ